MATEAWLRGPLEGVDPLLMPAAHALIEAADNIEEAAGDLTVEEMWTKPGGAPSVGFHLQHIIGSIDRLLTYARGHALSEEQHRFLHEEAEPNGDPPATASTLVLAARARIDEAVQTIRATRRETLLEPRAVGQAKLPTNVVGLLFHIAEHTQRHTGQIVTTAKIVRGSSRIN